MKLHRLRSFVSDFGGLVFDARDEETILTEGGHLLANLVKHDDWLSVEFSQPKAEHYQQYLLHCDSQERFSVVSFVWGPGQKTPIHNHTVWGLVGILRGAELCQPYDRCEGQLVRRGEAKLMQSGDVEGFPTYGDIHEVSNAFDDRISVSIHVYGGNIGRTERSVFDISGSPKRFVSGYANDTVPNIWRK